MKGLLMKNSIFVIINDHEPRVKLREYFEGLGHYVVSTASAADALDLLQNISRPNLIIIGGNFPLLSVSDYLKIIKNDVRLASIPAALIKSSKGPLEGTCFELDMENKQSWSEVLKHCLVDE